MKTAILFLAVLIGPSVARLHSDESKTSAPAKENPGEVINLPVRTDGIVLFLGTAIKDGEKVPTNEVVTIKTDSGEKRFRQFKVGDRITEGQLIGSIRLLTSRDYSLDWSRRKGEYGALNASKMSADFEVIARYRRLRDNTKPLEILPVSLRLSRSIMDEQIAMFMVNVAGVRVNLSELTLPQVELRANVSGEVTSILTLRGEGAKNWTIVRIRPDHKDRK